MQKEIKALEENIEIPYMGFNETVIKYKSGDYQINQK